MNDKRTFIAATAALAMSLESQGTGRSISHGSGIDRSKIRAKRK